ncbi:MAG: tRNA (adenosine(37)-N6)-dimethylallyltransferase MiaA [Chloroflexi bacterium]|nr:tRNA (adenosine(37)-N6)-dimethylallyltransferase MiaA [Chloroflexota bacterium]MYD15616.1 tRNA (adenosine(37)-N6)-dimethylallyltransferase MiaA [Chloroflexota bacterium]MYJ02617.1 tRNA (adenosine(37)-N6)-dimethylallyltransferase MiaA [Chloroflexota bacterium]
MSTARWSAAHHSNQMTSSPSPGPSPPQPDQRPLIAVVGLTASGKSDWALRIAQHLDGEIVSIDSRQIYRRLDIGTAKPTAAMRETVPHWCIDIVEPTERYSLGAYLKAARTAIDDIRARGKRPIAVGGSGQHMRALLEGWQVPPVESDEGFRESLAKESTRSLFECLNEVDPEAARQIGPTNTRRIIRALEVHHVTGTPISVWQRLRESVDYRAVAPDLPLDALDDRIAQRTSEMFEAGLVDEVRDLLADGTPADAPGFDAIGYREVLAHLSGELTLDEAISGVVQATRRFARRQRTWFRRDDPSICWSADVPLAMLG